MEEGCGGGGGLIEIEFIGGEIFCGRTSGDEAWCGTLSLMAVAKTVTREMTSGSWRPKNSNNAMLVAKDAIINRRVVHAGMCECGGAVASVWRR